MTSNSPHPWSNNATDSGQRRGPRRESESDQWTKVHTRTSTNTDNINEALRQNTTWEIILIIQLYHVYSFNNLINSVRSFTLRS